MSQNQAQTLGLQRPQRQEFTSLIIAGEGTYNIDINCSFPVKEVHFRTAYSFSSNKPAAFVLKAPTLVPEGSIIGSMFKTVADIRAAAPAFLYTDSFNDAAAVRYIFRDPRIINGSFSIVADDILPTSATITNGRIMLHVELLG